MTTLAEAIRSEAVQLKAKASTTLHAINEGVRPVLDKAESLKEDCDALGAEATERLFGSLEKSLRVFAKADAVLKAQDKALSSIASKLPADASPADVQAAFTVAVTEATVDDEEELARGYEPLAKMRKLARDVAGAGASSSQAADNDELGEDGFALTQEARSTKCCLLQVEMQAAGELRPMRAPCGHCFSHKAISAHCAKQRGKQPAVCPQAGCERKFTLDQLAEDKEVNGAHTGSSRDEPHACVAPCACTQPHTARSIVCRVVPHAGFSRVAAAAHQADQEGRAPAVSAEHACKAASRGGCSGAPESRRAVNKRRSFLCRSVVRSQSCACLAVIVRRASVLCASLVCA